MGFVGGYKVCGISLLLTNTADGYIVIIYPWGVYNNYINNYVKEEDKMQITVNKNRCPQNHPCPAVRVCPAGAIKQTGFDLPVIDQEKCIQCRKCIMYCPMGAIQGK